MLHAPSSLAYRFIWLNHRLILLFFIALTSTTPATALDLERAPYLQQPTSSSIIIRWRTDSNVQGVVRYGDTATNLSQSVTSSTSTTEHSVQINGLSANTRYYYSVGTDSQTLAGASADYFFTTAPATNTSLTTKLWILGDSGTNNNNARDVRDAYLTYLSNNSKADMLLMLGDNAYDDGTDTQYQSAMFDMYPTVLRNTPVWATIGNHDGQSADSATESGAYYDIFTFPRAAEVGGTASGTEAYYSFDYNNIHFISLDSHETDRSTNGAMATWLTQDLADTTQQWIIAFWHHPPYSKGSHDSDSSDEEQTTEMRNNFLPILEEAGVDLVLSGHSHSYERSKFIDGHYGNSSSLQDSMILNAGDGNSTGDGAYTKQATKTPHKGTVYVVAGSSGQLGPGTLDHPVMYKSLRNLGSMIIDIKDNRLDAFFLRENGSIPDTFSIVKSGTTPDNPTPDNPTTNISFQNDNLPNTNYNGTSDAYIAQANTNNNQGSATDLLLDGDDGNGNDLASLIRWEIANFVPTGVTIESASVTFDVFNSSGSSYEIYALKRAWNESQVTWNQADDNNNWQSAGAEGTNDRDTQVLGTVNANNTGSLTINFNTAGLAMVQQWLNDPSSNYGIIIANSSSSDGADFYSSEFSTVTSRPKLSLRYRNTTNPPTTDNEPPTIPANLRETGVTSNSVSLSWNASTDNVAVQSYRVYRDSTAITTITNTSYTDNNLTANTAYTYTVDAIDTSNNASAQSSPITVNTTTPSTQDTGTAKFQNGNLPDSSYNGTNDAYIAQADPDNNQGNASDLLLDGDGNGIASLIRWEIANALPSGAIIDSASITVQVFNTSGASYEIYALKHTWTDIQTTWNQADNSSNWQSVGAEGDNDRGSQVLGSINANNSGSLAITFNAAGVTAIQQWIDNPSSNYGIIIANASHGDGVGFYSSEFDTLSSRPMLSLDYHTN